ncbi:hypothetical protein BDM02DRAFT_2314732 [Thelephora ganbajun]|uniref:Uncharacterized protein n=1 Tax=Thelephora ganbajun TaxID=370292 RepID=A0ACB6ZF74_THEGA|nr:hypothetical protein BDM02DRAFT_2314732 [Thelephora ganbajun]
MFFDILRIRNRNAATAHIVRILHIRSVGVGVGTTGIPHAAAAAAAVAEVGKRHTVGSGRLPEGVEVGVHHRSTPGTAVVDVRTVVEIHILQVERGEADTKVVSSGEVGTQGSAGNGSAAVVVALGVDTGYAEAEAVEANTSFVAVENTCSAEAVVGWKPGTASWDCCPIFLARHKDRGRVSVGVVDVVGCRIAEIVVGVGPVEMVPHRIGSASAQGLTNRTDSGKVGVGVETWW